MVFKKKSQQETLMNLIKKRSFLKLVLKIVVFNDVKAQKNIF